MGGAGRVIGTDAFRAGARAWLEANGARFASVKAWDREGGREFRRALWDAGLLGITLKHEYGGQGLDDEYQKIFDEEASRYELPATGDPVTTGICAPVLLEFGAEEQKWRHLPRMFRGDEVWCQLLSEPGAGSDLASIQTRAIPDGDDFVVTGQKVWTGGAQYSDFALCLARTDRSVPKHQGLSMFIVDLRAMGVTIQPLREMTGRSRFNEVFLDDVRVSPSGLVGDLNDGWRQLTAMLGYERMALGTGIGAGGTRASWTRPASERLIDLARRRGRTADPVVRQELARLYSAEKVLVWLGQRLRHDPAVGSKGSLAKLASSHLARQSSDLGMVVVGSASQAWEHDDSRGHVWSLAALFSPMNGIAGGTSEIQRNTIGERVLGLPREPQVDKDVPFNQVAQNTIHAPRRS
jgi:alkylation response protein AidB-like acyl-CoA dehydrogenase